MNIYKKDDFHKILQLIKKGAIFVYPTDTIYGIGCDATNNDAVKKLRQIKKQFERPFSVIVPSKEWIRQNCIVNNNAEQWLQKLPGPYTLILPLKNKKCVASSVITDDTLGIRIPSHWCSELASSLQKPIVTTSANISGKPFITIPLELEEELKKQIDFVIDEGVLSTKPSTIVDLTNEEKIVRR
ncbi:MAG: L-threonylcarbamoyladenylate synthase [Candidatus Woesearchaeota archaeon]